MSCLIIGDSIAKGVADIRKDCVAYVQTGISTIGWSRKWINKIDSVGDSVFISLGSNDQWKDFEDTADELYRIRIHLEGKQVVWVLPANKIWVRELIEEIAYDYGDTVIEIREVSRDRVHPTGRAYKDLARTF